MKKILLVFFVVIEILNSSILNAETSAHVSSERCSVLLTYNDVEACYVSINQVPINKPIHCGSVNIETIMQGAIKDGLPPEKVGRIWNHLASLVLNECNYNAETKESFLRIEKLTQGVDGWKAREAALAAENRTNCLINKRNFFISNPKAFEIGFYSHVSKSRFGGGINGDIAAVKYLEVMASSGKIEEIRNLQQQFLDSQCR